MITQGSGIETPEAARTVFSMGFSPIPYPRPLKGPEGASANEWQEKAWRPEDFKPGMNIGVHHDGNPAAIDRDCDEARALIGQFTPNTRMSGRESAPMSHAWYTVEGAPPFLQLKDSNGKMMIELRYGKGKQTVIPPSVHPNGDRYITYNPETPIATISAADLERGVRLEAATCLLAKHYPPSGGRYNWGLHVAGFLLRNGMDRSDKEGVELDADTVIEMMLASRELQGPFNRNTEKEITKVVTSTVAKLEEGANITGGTRLKEEYADSEKLPGRLAHVLGWRKPIMEDEPRKAKDKEDKRNQADRLIQYALDARVPLFVDQFLAPHALVDGEAVPLTTRSYNWLRGTFWEHEKRSVTGEALKTAAGTLAAFASASGDVRTLHTRSAHHDGAIYYQLGRGRIVEVSRHGWRMMNDPPVLFRSIPNLKPLPDPERAGSFAPLEALTNLKSDREKRLFTAHVVTIPLEHIQRPIFQPTGVNGSGKSTASRAIKRALDPTAPEAVRFDPRDFLQKASHSYIVMLDNQNSLPEWAVDMLCRLVTGEADSKRKHYTDDDDVIYELKRAVLLNGINAPTDRGDAQERTLPIELERIPDDSRLAEEELWARFNKDHGRVLGAIFDTLAKAMAKRPEIQLDRRPRLTDWGYYVGAVYEVMGWGAKQFQDDWVEVVKAQNQETLSGSALGQCIISIMEVHNVLEIRPDKLLEMLETEAQTLKIDTKRDKKWPGSASWVYRRIKEIIPLLASRDISVPPPIATKEGNLIRLIRGGGGGDNGGDDGGGSRFENGGSIFGENPSASTDASTENSAEACGGEQNKAKGGSSGGISGLNNTPSNPFRESAAKGENRSKSGTGRKVLRNASTASTASTASVEDVPDDHVCRQWKSHDVGEPSRCPECTLVYNNSLNLEQLRAGKEPYSWPLKFSVEECPDTRFHTVLGEDGLPLCCAYCGYEGSHE